MTKKDENGMAAIIIVTVLIVLLSLITVGFSRLMSRSTNNSLNNQLSTSASYAAQSGVNDALKYIKDQYSADPNSPVSSNSCNQLLNGALADQTNISSDGNTKVTCLLVNPSPKDLVYQQIPEDGSQVIKLNTSASLDSLMVSWRSSDTTQRSFPAGLSLSSIDAWGTNNPLLRVTLYPIPQSKLVSGVSSKTFFLYPRSASATFTHVTTYGGGAVADGSIVSVNCGNKSPAPFNGSADYDCNTTFDNLSSAMAPTPAYYYVRVTPLYNNADLKIKANDTTKSALTFNHDQAVIDVTAKAGSAVKRVQERVDTNLEGTNISPSSAGIPELGLRTALSLCKRLNVTNSPINTTVDGGICAAQGGGVVDAPPAPTPVTGSYSNLTYNSVDVVGTVNPNGINVTDCRFVYGTNAGSLSYSTPSYASCSSLPGAGKSAVGVSAHLSGLNGGTKYYYALCAKNDYANACDTSAATNPGGGGGGGGGDGSFTTPPPPDPVIEVWSWTGDHDIFSYRVRNANRCVVHPDTGGSDTTLYPVLGRDFPVVSGVPYIGATLSCWNNNLGPVSSHANGLPVGTTNYHINAVTEHKIKSGESYCGDAYDTAYHNYVICVNWHWDSPVQNQNVWCTVAWNGSVLSGNIYERITQTRARRDPDGGIFYYHVTVDPQAGGAQDVNSSYDTFAIGFNSVTPPDGNVSLNCRSDLDGGNGTTPAANPFHVTCSTVTNASVCKAKPPPPPPPSPPPAQYCNASGYGGGTWPGCYCFYGGNYPSCSSPPPGGGGGGGCGVNIPGLSRLYPEFGFMGLYMARAIPC